jgi:acyl dehydratase
MKNSLPLLKDMILPSFFTLSKGVKIKEGGIAIKKEFKNVTIDEVSLKKYTQFFDWEQQHPLAFFYLMAQRAQTSLMLQPNFTIAIPGLVHISNRIEKLGVIDCALPFDLIANVVVDFKDVGSLIPKFTVNFFQNNEPVIFCESTYVAKRKGNKRDNPSVNKEAFITKPFSSEIWEIPKNLGQIYATASGDKNPIHSSKVFARIIGFPRPILQGWYSISRIVKEYETENAIAFQSIEVDFKSPVFLPSQQKVDIQKNDKNEVLFQLTDMQTNIIVLYGKLK